jgi:hypothetical protein
MSGDNAAWRLKDTLERDVADCLCRCQTDDIGLKIAQNAIVESIDQPMHGNSRSVCHASQQCGPARLRT